MVPHAGVNSPVWREVTALGDELAALGGELRDADVAAEHAIVFSWPARWALKGTGQPSAEIRMTDQAGWMYRPLFEAGITADFTPPSGQLSRYRTVLVPNLHLVTDHEAENLVAFAERGGTVLLAFWSGIVDERDHVYLGPYGGPLRPLIGRRTAATRWMDIIDEPAEGTVLARYASGPWAGRPAVLTRRVGEGQAMYLGTQVDSGRLATLLGLAATVPDGVERVVRSSATVSYEFLLNHGTADAKIGVDGDGVDLLTGTPVAAEIVLPPAGVAIIRRRRSSPAFGSLRVSPERVLTKNPYFSG
jgi:beta-galactosidase